MKDWNPDHYLQFKNERTQPSIDLVSRISLANPRSIIDLGCGPGNSTQVLVNRWPYSDITGLDSSSSMIEKARLEYPAQKWIIGDAAKPDPDARYDLVFSNATLQWIPDHESFIPRLYDLVAPGGAFAVQIPRFRNMPIHDAIEKIAGSSQWDRYTRGCEDLFTFHDAAFYYDALSPHAHALELWETSYFHILDSLQMLIDFIKSTGMKPFLDRLPSPEMKLEFEKQVFAEAARHYKVQANGKVLFPFERMFFIAYRS